MGHYFFDRRYELDILYFCVDKLMISSDNTDLQTPTYGRASYGRRDMLVLRNIVYAQGRHEKPQPKKTQT